MNAETQLSIAATNMSAQPLADIHDRVTEAYYGKMGPQFMRETQERIHWICNNVQGRSVLDVGCSQGIVPILLAREGIKVVGIDTSPSAIEEAKQHLASEPAHVQGKITFVNDDFLSHDFQPLDIETVVISEVLEHLVQPQAFIDAAAKLLPNNGRLIITVPFGINDFIDHKHTFYLLEPYRLIAKHFEIREIAVLGKWLGIVASNNHSSKSKTVTATLTEAQIEQLEAAFFQIERRLRDDLVATHTKLSDANQKYRTACDQITANKQRIEQEVAARIATEEKLQQAAIQLTQTQARLEGERTVLQLQITQLGEQVKSGSVAAQEAEEKYIRLESEHGSVRARLDDANKKYRTATDQITSIKREFSQQKQQLEIAEKKRSGHYEHLELERKKNKQLAKQVELLEKDNKRMTSSLSLAVGEAIVKTKNIKDIFLLPRKIFAATAKHKEKLRSKELGRAESQTQLEFSKKNEKNPPLEDELANKRELLVNAQPIISSFENKDPSPSKQAVPEVTDIMVLGWPLPEKNSKIKAMSIFDEFSRECFAPLMNLIEPRPDNWLPLLVRDKPELLFVESTWRGNKSTWQYRVAKYAHPPGKELSEMVSEFKARKIPTIFWNKEDPVHFDNFIHAAKEFDYIFTTAEEAVPRYAQVSKAKIAVLPFAAEVRLHNPIGSGHRNEKVCFAGSYYANRFSERRDDQLMLLDAASHFELDIYDRNAGANASKDFCFPQRFDKFIRGKLPYDEMSKAYRNYRVFLNVNSVIDSKTMFSRRVFELMACGTPIVSTISAGIEDMFGDNLVWMVKNEAEAKEAIHTLLNSPDEWRRRSLQGIRSVFAQHTFTHRLQDVLRTTGIRDNFIQEKSVLLVAEVRSQDELNSVVDTYSRQKLVNTKTWLLIIDREHGLLENSADIELVHSNEPLSKIVPKVAKRRQVSHIAFIAPTALYGAYYLQDLLHAFDYSDASLVGKPCSGMDEYAYGNTLIQAGSVLSTKLLELTDFHASALDAGNLAAEVRRIGEKVFMSDAANFINSTEILTVKQRSSALKQVEI